MRNIRSYIAVCAAALAFADVPTASADELVVSAAASLTNAFRDIGRRLADDHPATRLVFNFAATDVLLAQISKGAPVDVFAAADEETMDRADREGLLLAGSRRDFAANRLVLIVPAGAPAIADLAALTRLGRIAIGNPRTVPAGRYAKAALERAQVWQAVEPHAVYAVNVRQVLDYVARKEVDAGFVYATDAAMMRDKVKVALD